MDGALSDWFAIKKGVRQGCLLTPVCLHLYSEAVMRASVDETPWTGISGRKIDNLRFAADIVLIATSHQHLTSPTVSNEFQLEISITKTKVMTTKSEQETSLEESEFEFAIRIQSTSVKSIFIGS